MGSPSFKDWLFNTELITDDEVQSPVNLVSNLQLLQDWENFYSKAPLMNNFLFSDPLYDSISLRPTQGNDGAGFSCWDELGVVLRPQSENPLLPSEQHNLTNGDQEVILKERRAVASSSRWFERGPRKRTKIKTESITWEVVSQYFHLSSKKAARELKIGSTTLKNRCKDLGIKWPHRKLRSIQKLINELKELPEEPGLREAIRSLESEKETLEKNPDMDLSEYTKVLRQRWSKEKCRLKHFGS